MDLFKNIIQNPSTWLGEIIYCIYMVSSNLSYSKIQQDINERHKEITRNDEYA